MAVNCLKCLGIFGTWLTLAGQVFTQFSEENRSIGDQKVYFYFFKRPKHYNKEVLSHSFICLSFPYMEGIVLLCNIDLYCVIAIFNGHW